MQGFSESTEHILLSHGTVMRLPANGVIQAPIPLEAQLDSNG